MTAPQRLGAGASADLDLHLARHGRLPLLGAVRPGGLGPLATELAEAGLRGRGGGWFPTARKLAAVAAATRSKPPVVVVNAMEGEPLSGKDAHLLAAAPHLVLDGATLAAETVGAQRIILAVKGRATGVAQLVAERARRGLDPVEIVVMAGPDGYLAGQETALVNWIGGGPAVPTSSRPFERGVDRRPTLLSNTETYAQIALIARRGAAWFRSTGTREAPGSTLVTVSGAIGRPGVFEVAVGTPVRELIRLAGGLTEPPSALLFGGYGGAWIAADRAGALPLAPEPLRAAGAAFGPGIVSVLSERTCGLAHTAGIVRWMADQGARQCGPCLFGLPAVAGDLGRLAAPGADRETLRRLRRRTGLPAGRGACAHPDGTARLVASALDVFSHEVEAHLSGRCDAQHVHAKAG